MVHRQESRVFLNDEWTVNKRLLFNAGGMAENYVWDTGASRLTPRSTSTLTRNRPCAWA